MTELLNNNVLVTLNDSNMKIHGQVIHIDKARHGDLGNVIMRNLSGQLLIIKGNMVKTIAQRNN